MIVVLMGVCGCGKTSVGQALAEKLSWEFADADLFHPDVNKQKMSAGVPLTDEDRYPWLRKLHTLICSWASEGRSGVLACSALKKSYREVLTTGQVPQDPSTSSVSPRIPHQHSDSPRPNVLFVYLKGSKDVVRSRLESRTGHFMPAGLLDSQFLTLEEPDESENSVSVEIAQPLMAVVMDIYQIIVELI
ncbi:probable gluconokinase [Branchiostoma floridae]|uniref:Probable gluconokinase n=1 Tax=Branchiostoma floridae TaxID=7739 RepID=A0A9J7KPI3_BRAFL|nr:probable gluconokinase [Branchiostoma floridae]